MDISQSDLEKYLFLIFTSEKLEIIDDMLFMFRQPSNYIKMKANLIYNRSFGEAVKEGMLPLDELEKLIVERGFFTENDEKRISSLESKLNAQSVLLSKVNRVGGDPTRVMGVISNIKSEIEDIKYKKYSRLTLSAENKAVEDKYAFMCSCCTYNDEHYLYWESYDLLLKETDIRLKNLILNSFTGFCSGVETKIVRIIARWSIWRIRYVSSCKTGDSLFGVSVSDYTNDQLHLAYWSNFYQNVYDMMPEDRPSDLIIEDDDSLDSYMTSYYEERTREDARRRSKSKTKGSMSAFDKEEVIITKSNELYEDIKYSKPREAQKVKDRVDLKKRAISGNRQERIRSREIDRGFK